MRPRLKLHSTGSDKLTVVTILVVLALLLAFFYFAIMFKYFD
jgi:hypothetical protein